MIQTTIFNQTLLFETTPELFSPSAIDSGTLAMLSKISLQKGDKLLDLGCGYGIVGITAAKLIGSDHVVMSDISEACVQIAEKNALLNQAAEGLTIIRGNGFENIAARDFTLILSNPPYHTDFSVAKEFIEQGWKHLSYNGKIYMVTKRKDWYQNKLTSVFGGVTIYEVNGYYVFCSEKRKKTGTFLPVKKQKLSKKLQRKYNLTKDVPASKHLT